MPVTTRIEPLARDLQVMVNDALSPQARSAALAEFAREQIEQTRKANQAATGRVQPVVIVVDGKRGAPLQSVRPDGTIVAEFQFLQDILVWIHQQLQMHSPVARGDKDPNPNITYSRSHKLYADGAEIAATGQIPPAAEYVFANSVPYTRKIELGASSQAPNGVYEAVAVLARRRFGNIARIFFTYVNADGERSPAVIIRTR